MPNALNNVLYNIVKVYNEDETAKAERQKREPKFLPWFSAHVLRHTGCMHMAESGMDSKILQYIMGHTNISITLNVYTHITEWKRLEDEMHRIDEQGFGVKLVSNQ